MPIGRWFLPKSVNARLAAFLNYLRKAFRLSLEELHNSAVNGAPGGCAYRKKSARELRQGGSNYRCCIPALAGFVSPQSIAPDGGEISSHKRDAQLKNAAACRCHGVIVSVEESALLTVRCASVCIERVKWLAFLLLAFVFVAATSCTTLVNRRDLYSPEPAPDSLQAARQWYGGTTISTTTTIRTQRAAGEIAAPDFRY